MAEKDSRLLLIAPWMKGGLGDLGMLNCLNACATGVYKLPLKTHMPPCINYSICGLFQEIFISEGLPGLTELESRHGLQAGTGFAHVGGGHVGSRRAG